MLTKQQKEYFRRLLNCQLEALMAEVDSSVSMMTESSDPSYDFIDQATIESGIDLNLHMKERHHKMLLKIKDALDRLSEGSYGICEACGEAISHKRLEARPVAALCISCKRKQEADEKMRGL